ncbi:unnamed protein product [Cyprideis torosa]|uniref:Uncharacterized protein n=1 Tax=Cyprideis torosa TaxID=163714 RepID=A0A7R8ZNB9_9CRUS|nr:unnamed protein product [Cyprideis torosa]CAG0887517.1 unnamed protein product [Cyprideis torosa]
MEATTPSRTRHDRLIYDRETSGRKKSKRLKSKPKKTHGLVAFEERRRSDSVQTMCVPATAFEDDLKVPTEAVFQQAGEPSSEGIQKEKIIINDRYKVHKKLGSGCFGEVWYAYDMVTDHYVAAKFEEKSIPIAALHIEYRFIHHLRGIEGIPRAYYFGHPHPQLSVMVMELLGRNLDDLFEVFHRQFSTKTIYNIGLQLVQRFQAVHDRFVIFRDVKPENFVIGREDKRNLIYMIDFGLSKMYRNPVTRKHIPFRERKSLTGTARYMSVNTHFGREQSRRDDLEALGYMLIYFFRKTNEFFDGQGHLPWMGMPGKTVYEKYKKIGELKRRLPIAEICEQCPIQQNLFNGPLSEALQPSQAVQEVQKAPVTAEVLEAVAKDVELSAKSEDNRPGSSGAICGLLSCFGINLSPQEKKKKGGSKSKHGPAVKKGPPPMANTNLMDTLQQKEHLQQANVTLTTPKEAGETSPDETLSEKGGWRPLVRGSAGKEEQELWATGSAASVTTYHTASRGNLNDSLRVNHGSQNELQGIFLASEDLPGSCSRQSPDRSGSEGGTGGSSSDRPGRRRRLNEGILATRRGDLDSGHHDPQRDPAPAATKIPIVERRGGGASASVGEPAQEAACEEGVHEVVEDDHAAEEKEEQRVEPTGGGGDSVSPPPEREERSPDPQRMLPTDTEVSMELLLDGAFGDAPRSGVRILPQGDGLPPILQKVHGQKVHRSELLDLYDENSTGIQQVLEAARFENKITDVLKGKISNESLKNSADVGGGLHGNLFSIGSQKEVMLLRNGMEPLPQTQGLTTSSRNHLGDYVPLRLEMYDLSSPAFSVIFDASGSTAAHTSGNREESGSSIPQSSEDTETIDNWPCIDNSKEDSQELRRDFDPTPPTVVSTRSEPTEAATEEEIIDELIDAVESLGRSNGWQDLQRLKDLQSETALDVFTPESQSQLNPEAKEFQPSLMQSRSFTNYEEMNLGTRFWRNCGSPRNETFRRSRTWRSSNRNPWDSYVNGGYLEPGSYIPPVKLTTGYFGTPLRTAPSPVLRSSTSRASARELLPCIDCYRGEGPSLYYDTLRDREAISAGSDNHSLTSEFLVDTLQQWAEGPNTDPFSTPPVNPFLLPTYLDGRNVDKLSTHLPDRTP